MTTILESIAQQKRQEIRQQKKKADIAYLLDKANILPPCHSLKASLSAIPYGIICEFKRKSPSKPTINLTAKVEDIIPSYTIHGAAGISVLTDMPYFGGYIHDLIEARLHTHLPILRKEFILNEFQILEARANGADAILLIAEILSSQQVHDLAHYAVSLGMEVIFEFHHHKNLKKYIPIIPIIGVNNRNLDTFITDIAYSIDIFPDLPEQSMKISESGLHTPEHVKRLQNVGYSGFLIGEAFMSDPNPGNTFKLFIDNLKQPS